MQHNLSRPAVSCYEEGVVGRILGGAGAEIFLKLLLTWVPLCYPGEGTSRMLVE